MRFANFSGEMETATGKAYVYLRTARELNRRYGMRKFTIGRADGGGSGRGDAGEAPGGPAGERAIDWLLPLDPSDPPVIRHANVYEFPGADASCLPCCQHGVHDSAGGCRRRRLRGSPPAGPVIAGAGKFSPFFLQKALLGVY